MNSIVLICDDAYVFPTMVTIQSIINSEKNTNDYFQIYVCTFEMSDENIERLEDLSNANINVEVLLVDYNRFKPYFEQVTQRSHVTKTALIKLELPNIFTSLNKILYLDSDIIVKKSLLGLFSIDLSECYLAAAYEFLKYWEQELYYFKPFRYSGPYLNSGVMLLNLKKMREDDISKRFWDYKLSSCTTTAMDQETINAVCGHNMYNLSVLYNFNPIFYNKDNLIPFKKVYGISYNTIDELLDDVVIIHYVGKLDKPWKYKDAHLGCYWEQAYNSLESKEQLHYCQKESNKRSFGEKIIGKVSEHGILGTLHFVLYKIGIRL